MASAPSRNGRHFSGRIAVPTQDRLPPQNLDCERAVLAGMIRDNEQIPGVLAQLRAADFYRDAHEIVFRAIQAVHQAGRGVDAIILTDELKRREEYDRIGGDETIDEILGSVVHAANTPYHAAIVAEKARMRRALEACQDTERAIYAGIHTSDELAERTTQSLNELANVPGRRTEEPVIVQMEGVAVEETRWLWPNRLPLGAISLLMGDPGLGKSFVTCAFAATVSGGGSWPGMQGECVEPANVLFLTAEDSLSRTIKPRLVAMGADCRRVYCLTTKRLRNGKQVSVSLSDVELLEQTLERIGGAKLIVIDPVSAYLGGKADENKNAEVRSLISPLSALAERADAALLLVTHLNKGSGTKAIYRATSSLAFVAAARTAWMFARDRDDPSGLKRLMLPSKCNIMAEPSGWSYRIVDGGVQWIEEVNKHADDALEREGRRNNDEPKRGPLPEKARQAAEWIKAALEAKGGRSQVGPLQGQAEENGHEEATFYRALNQLRADGAVRDIKRPFGTRGKWVALADVAEAQADADGYDVPGTF